MTLVYNWLQKLGFWPRGSKTLTEDGRFLDETGFPSKKPGFLPEELVGYACSVTRSHGVKRKCHVENVEIGVCN